MKELKKYQEKAIDDLTKYSKELLNQNDSHPIILESPTGSGKTYIATKYIEEFANQTNEDICFLWLTIGKGQLHEQCMKSVKKEISKEFSCNLLEEEYFGTKNYIEQNEIVFISWQKIKLKDNTTGKWKALVMKEKETTNFIEVLEKTRQKNRKIVLIIDESHAGAKTEKSFELIEEIIKPNLTIEMSATPIINKKSKKITIDPTEVIEEGMIKKEIIINCDIDKIPSNDIDSLNLIVLSAIKKQKELKKLYKEEKSNVNPLVLIQLPNSKIGDEIKIEVETILKENDITEENGKLAVWMNDEKINNEYEKLLKNNSKVEYLLFKQAIDTGWDCPRAQILLKFRETKSIIFEIQTIGRILRMPEAKHYNNEQLNASYVYTNIKNIIVKKEKYNPNIIKSCKSMIKNNYEPIYLTSYYKQKKEYSIISSLFIPIFCHTFTRFFTIDENKKRQSYKINLQNFEQSGISEDFSNTDSILNNTKVDINNIDKEKNNVEQDNLINIKMSQIDLQYSFEQIIRQNLNGFTPKLSINQVKSAIMYAMKKYLNIQASNNGIVYIENIVVNNKEIFSKIIDESTKDYKTIYDKRYLEENELWNDNWHIEDIKNYNPNNYIEVKSKLSLHQPLYIELQSNGKVNEEELEFITYLDNQNKYIEWFWINGSEHSQKNFAIKTINNKSFQPNIIIKFKDGRIGIFDIKKSKAIDNSTKCKALQNYIKEQNNNIIGGIIHKDKNNFRAFTKSKYIEFNTDASKWNYFEDILKKQWT